MQPSCGRPAITWIITRHNRLMVDVSQQDRMRRSPKKKWFLAAACLGIFTIIAVPRLHRTITYQQKISAPAISRTLALKLRSESPQEAVRVKSVDTHYSTFKLPADVFSHMQAHETWLVLTGQSAAEVLLTEVGYPTELSADGNFTFYADAIAAQPATAWEVFTMSDPEFKSHLRLIVGKAATPYADAQVDYFETPHVKGFIRHGSAQFHPDIINIAVWDNTNHLFQEITITISDPQIRREVANTIAASYRFTVQELPSRDVLVSLAQEAVATFNPKAG